MPFAELLAAILDGRVRDAPVMVAVLTAHERGLLGRAVPGHALGLVSDPC